MIFLGETASSVMHLMLVAGLALLIPVMADPRRTLHRTLLLVVSILLALRYLWWRATETIAPFGLTWDWAASWSLLGLEMAAVFGSISAFVMLSRTKDRGPEADANLSWWGDQPAPRVAILIATYNEDQEVLERTIIGALGLRHDNKTIHILDDGKRDWLRDYCDERGVDYIRRPDNRDAKAGNINHALQSMAGDPPEFVAVLDADFVPHRGFLSRTLALFHDPTVGLVQTPQHFFNADPIQHNLNLSRSYPDEQRFFFDTMQASRDAWDIAFCCGTSSVARWQALEDIGWMPTDSVTEDFMVTVVMQNAAWRTVYLNEALTEGLAPEGLKEYITQRARWCLGMMQIARSRVGPFSRSKIRLRDRWSILDAGTYWMTTFPFRIAALVYPLLYWYFNIIVVDARVPEVISFFGVYYLWTLAALNHVSKGNVVPFINDVSQLVGAFQITRAAFTGLLRPHGQPFKVTAKGGDRSRIQVQWNLMTPFIIILALTLVGLLLGIFSDRFAYFDAGDGKAVVLFWLIGATDGHAKNFSIALMPGGRFRMTPLYDVLTVQPSLDVGTLQIKDMKLAMRAGKGRHYRGADIHGRHFVETALAAGFSREQVSGVFEDIRRRAEQAFDGALAEMPPGSPEGLAAAVRQGFEHRVARLVVGSDE